MNLSQAAEQAALARALAGVVGADAVVEDPRERRLYRGGLWGPADPEGRFGRTPALVVKPGSPGEVATCLRLIVDAGCPVLAVGGGTGVTGGQLPTAETVVLDLARLNRVQAIDRASRRARADAAVKLGALAAAAEAEGLLFAHDPWSQSIASVGGAISTNGVGYLAAGYGTMGQQVLGLQVALTTGELVDLPAAETSAAGPDLSRLFVGSEGTLGVITAATLRLFPQPERRLFLAARFRRFEDGFEALQAAAAIRLPLAMVDYEEDEEGPSSTFYAAVDGVRGAAEAVEQRLRDLIRAAGGELRPAAEVEHFWRTRHESAERYARQLAEHRAALLAADEEPPTRRRRSGWRYIHVALPAGEVLTFRDRARQRAAERRVKLHSAGIWGSPDLFSFVLEGSPATTEQTADELMLEAARAGGSFEYCHGVGLRLAHLMPAAMGPAMPVLRRIKAALDPSGLLNPGKQGLVR